MILRIKTILAAMTLAAVLCACSSVSARDSWETYWMPEGVSSYSKDIDNLFFFVLGLTGVVFIATEGALLTFIVKYRKKEGQKSFYTHGNHTLEMIWTITPAVILIFIALIQARTWNKIKDSSSFPDSKAGASINDYVKVQLFAEQFSWYFRYPMIVTGKDGKQEYKYGVPGTFTTDRTLTVPKNKPVIVEMTSKDVIHSFFLPYMRLKQDVVPGMMIKCWFDASKSTEEMRADRPQMVLTAPDGKPTDMTWDYPIFCAELCGIQHYQMWGRVKVLEQKEYDSWVASHRALVTPDANGDVKQEEQPIFANYWQVNPDTQERIYGGDTNKRSAFDFTEHEHEEGKH